MIRRYAIVIGACCSVLLVGLGYGLADASTQGIYIHPGDIVNVHCNTGVLKDGAINNNGTEQSVVCNAKSTTTTTTKPTTTTTTSHPTTTTTAPTTTTTVPITTTTTTAPTSGNCTNPVFTTSEATGTYNTDPGPDEFWWVDNDAWSGSHGPQTLNVCSQSSWYATSNQPNNGGQVETYPNTEYDVGGREHPSTTPISGYNSITSTFSETFPTTGDTIDAAYDLWTNNWSNETMIWNEWSGQNTFWGSCAVSADPATDCGATNTTEVAASLGGVGYHVIDLGGEVIFLRDTQVKTGSVDILAAFKFEVSQGWAKSSDVPTQLEYGVEICATTGTQTFPLTGLTFSLS